MNTLNRTTALACLAATLCLTSSSAYAQNNEAGTLWHARSAPRAVTMWWVIFNEPDNCVADPGATIKCGSIDIFGPAYLESLANGAPDPSLIAPNLATRLGVVYASGGITNRRGDVQFGASIYNSATKTAMALPPGADPLGLGRALEATDAEIHLVVRDHGRAHGRDFIAQISNFLDPYCSDPNLLYFAGPNICSDVQFAVFGSSESGEKDLFAFADPSSPLWRASAHLTRDGDVVRAYVSTRVRPSR